MQQTIFRLFYHVILLALFSRLFKTLLIFQQHHNLPWSKPEAVRDSHPTPLAISLNQNMPSSAFARMIVMDTCSSIVHVKGIKHMEIMTAFDQFPVMSHLLAK